MDGEHTSPGVSCAVVRTRPWIGVGNKKVVVEIVLKGEIRIVTD